MKGIVEIYRGEKLIHKEDNLIVDGASETLADILTISPTLADIPSASSILDASNYTIQAISFGKGEEAFGRNGHYFTEDKKAYLESLGIECVITSSGPVLNGSNLPTSGYLPDDDLPSHPDPLDTMLEKDVKFSSDASSLNNYCKLKGQNLNALNQDNGDVLTNGQLVGILGGVGAASGFIYASMVGCYPASEADGGTLFYMFSSVDGSASQDPSDLIFSATLNGGFNSASSMDQDGFVQMIMSSVPNGSYSLSSSFSGLTISANSDFSTNGEVMYEVMIASGDARCANLYGGITRMGLWTLDPKTSVAEGNNPPYARGPLNTTRNYRLFSSKTLNTDITASFPGNESPALGAATVAEEDTKVIWRLKFL